MARKRYNPDELDEEQIISTIQQQKQPRESPKAEPSPHRTSKRKREVKDYDALFIKESGSKARLGKHVPIRAEYHEMIQQIVRVIGKEEISIFNYIDNILTQHFDEYRQTISKRYKENSKDYFQ